MFLRAKRRFKDGKEHRYFSIVENRRISGRRVVQKQVLYLGEINDNQQTSWCQSILVLDGNDGREKQMALFPADRKPPPLPQEGSPRATGDASRSQEPFFQTRQTESSDASVPPGQDALSRAVSLEAARTYFQDEARLILSAERGLTPRAQGMLEGVAQRYGLSAEEADKALADLRDKEGGADIEYWIAELGPESEAWRWLAPMS